MDPIALLLLLATAAHGRIHSWLQQHYNGYGNNVGEFWSSAYKEEQNICELDAYPPEPESQCCGIDSSVANFIVGGKETKLRQFPWLVYLEYRNSKNTKTRFLCGGSLISGRYVLTAGHCLHIHKPRRIAVAVHLGDHYIYHRGQDCVIEEGRKECNDGSLRIEIESHKRFDNADLALIRLKKTVKFTDFIRPICLPPFNINHRHTNTKLFVAGWGLTEGTNNDKGLNNVKRYVDVSLKKCGHKYHVCTMDYGKDSCDGDSGGPLMAENDGQYYLVGVLSWGPINCGNGKEPAIYPNVYKFKRYIKESIKNDEYYDAFFHN